MTYEPYQCLTVKLDNLLANVHRVKDGEVFYGVYRDDALIGLYRKPVEEFWRSVELVLEQGGTVFSLLKEPFGDPRK